MYIEVEFWHWWVLALCFVVMEAMWPVVVFASMGLAAGILGGLLMGYPHMEIRQQLGIFGAFAMVAILISAHYRRKKHQEEFERGDTLAKNMIGREFELRFPVQNGFSEIKLDGQHWSLKGPPMSSGTLVKVIRLDGEMLLVFPADIVNRDQAEAKAKTEANAEAPKKP